MSLIIRRVQSPEELSQAYCLVESIYKNCQYVDYLIPPNPKQLASCFVAIENQKVVASVSVMIATQEPLPTEYLFDFR